MGSPTRIKEKKLLLVEGADAYYFSIWAYQAFGAPGIQVLDFGGITELRDYLKQLILLPGYETVETIAIARDAETDPSAAVDSIKGALRKVGLPVPGRPLEFASGPPRTAFYLFPQSSDGPDALQPGMLEDLCLDVIEDTATLECVAQYISCLNTNQQTIQYPHKTKLHAYLAGKNNFVGLKIGEAAKSGAWNWNHSKMQLFKQFIASI